MRLLFTSILLLLVIFGCDTSKMKETPDSQFLGKWKLVDRGLLEGIEMEISQNEKGGFSGVVTRLNDNKYVNMFMEEGDVLLSGIKRNSNFEFVISEKKIAAPLFSAYDLSTTSEFKALFKGKNRILLGQNGASGSYIRISDQ